MKSIFKFFIPVCILIAVMSSCDKAETDDISSGNYYFKCTVNGVALSGTTTMSDGNGAGANISGNFVNEQSQKKSAIIVFAENIGTKGLTTYTSTYTGYQDESGAWWRWKSGTFTITKWDDVKYEVAGTFNSLVFENPNDITKTIEVTDGRFYVMLAH